MRALLAFLVVAVLAWPVAAQQIRVPGGGTLENRSTPGEEWIGRTSTGLTAICSGTSFAGGTCSGGTANAKGSWFALGTASGATFREVCVVVGAFRSPLGAGSSVRIDVSFDGGTTTTITDLFFAHGPSNRQQVCAPLSVATTDTADAVMVRAQATTADSIVDVGLIGRLNADGQARPLWTHMSALTAPAGDTTVDDADITIGTGAGAYVELDAGLDQACDALLPAFGNASSVSNETIMATFATGAAGSENPLFYRTFARNSNNPRAQSNYAPLFYGPVAAGTRIAGKLDSAAGAGTARLGLYCFY